MAFQLSGLFNQFNTPAAAESSPPADRTGSAGGNEAGAGLKMLQNLLAGETFSGQVIGVSEGSVLLQLADGNAVSARLSAGSTIQVGQSVTFMVEENSANTISLKPLMTVQQQAVLIEKALDAADYPATDANINIVKELLNLKMPVNAQTIAAMVKNSLKYPGASLNTIANLIRLEMPVTAENIGQFEAYKSYEHSILKELNGIGREISAFLSDAGTGAQLQGDSAGMVKTAVLDGLIQAFYAPGAKEAVAGMPLGTYMNEDARTALTRQLTAVFTGAEATAQTAEGESLLAESAAQLIRELQSGNITTDQLLMRINALFKNDPAAAKQMGKLFASNEMNDLIEQMINETLKLTPADVARPDGILTYYRRVREALGKAQEAAGKDPGAAAIGKEMTSIQNHIDFMNDLNKNMTYFQMPVHFSERDANGEFYVFTNKKALQNHGDQVRALLHLDMDHLGPMDIYVQLNGKNVSTNFCLEREELLDFVYAHIDRLNARLEALGFSAKFEMKVSEPEEAFDFIENFIENDQPVKSTSQYIFDMKA